MRSAQLQNTRSTKHWPRNFSGISAHYQKVIKSEIKEIIPLSIQKIKYLRISAAQEVKDLYTETYKMLLRKINKI